MIQSSPSVLPDSQLGKISMSTSEKGLIFYVNIKTGVLIMKAWWIDKWNFNEAALLPT
jgi:hypothetical protein